MSEFYKIFKIAKHFKIHALHFNVNSESVIKYLNSIGYSVMFFDDITDNIIIGYDVVEYAQKFKAFTLKEGKTKCVFINNSLSAYSMLCSLLHETAHIILGHLKDNHLPQNNRIDEMEAEAFAYLVLTYKPKSKYLYALIVVVITSILLSITGFTYHYHFLKQDENMVYIMPTGTCYHKQDCIFTKDKSPTALTELEATRNYKPCKVCNP